jgi:invasion protein IalB
MRTPAWGVPVLLISACALGLTSRPAPAARLAAAPPAAGPAATAPAHAAGARAISPAAAEATPPAAALTPAAAEATVTAIWSVERADPASRDVVVRFVAAACSVVQRVVVEQSAARVVITLDQGGRNGKDCTEPFTRHRTVRLAVPLGDRPLYDGGIAPPALVRPGR